MQSLPPTEYYVVSKIKPIENSKPEASESKENQTNTNNYGAPDFIKLVLVYLL